MAKKRRRTEKEPEETYEFVPPEFDEKEFLLKDIYGTKVLLTVVALALIMGILAACMHKVITASDPIIHAAPGLLLIFLVIVGMKQLLSMLKFQVEHLEQKSFIGNYILFFFLSVGVWIVLLNPPF